MSARESAAVAAAAEQALAQPSLSLSEIARKHKIALTSLRRAMRRRGQPARPHPAAAASRSGGAASSAGFTGT